MKIAVSAMAPNLDAEVDPRFGRCQYFIVVDPETMEFEAVQNTNLAAAGGAGIATSQMIAQKGVEVVLTGNCGPNAYQALTASGIQVVTGVGGKARDAVEGYKAGRFRAASQPTVGAHFGMGGMGMGRGVGMGPGMVPPAGPAPKAENRKQELDSISEQARSLRQQPENIEQRISKLESGERS